VINAEGSSFFSSRNPSVNIELPSSYSYLGMFENTFNPRRLDEGEPRPTVKAEANSYLYVQLSSNERYLEKMVQIKTLELPVRECWHPDTMLIVKNPFKKSAVKLGKQYLQYSIKAEEATTPLSAQYLLDNGITTSGCYMSMLIGRVFSDNVKMYIYIYEDISNFKEFDIDSCQEWKEYKSLNDKQKEFIQEFENRVHNSIKFL